MGLLLIYTHVNAYLCEGRLIFNNKYLKWYSFFYKGKKMNKMKGKGSGLHWSGRFENYSQKGIRSRLFVGLLA